MKQQLVSRGGVQGYTLATNCACISPAVQSRGLCWPQVELLALQLVDPYVLLRPAQQVSNRRGEDTDKLSKVRPRWFVYIPSKDTATLVHIMPNGGCIPSKQRPVWE